MATALNCYPGLNHPYLATELLKVYRFDQLEHYLSCIFNGLRRLRKDHGIYSVASLRES